MRAHLAALLALVCLASCDDEPAAQAPTPTRSKRDITSQKGEASSQPAAVFIYSPVGKRDPFRPYYVDAALEDDEKQEGRAITDLEKFEIDQLRLVGIVSGIASPTAMFEDPTGRGHVVHMGTPMGKNGGRVNKIKKDEVVIMEEFRDPATNKKVQSPVTVRLPSDELVLE